MSKKFVIAMLFIILFSNGCSSWLNQQRMNLTVKREADRLNLENYLVIMGNNQGITYEQQKGTLFRKKLVAVGEASLWPSLLLLLRVGEQQGVDFGEDLFSAQVDSHSCVYDPLITLTDCSKKIVGQLNNTNLPIEKKSSLSEESFHITANRLMQKKGATLDWNALFKEEMGEVLNISPETIYYTLPLHQKGLMNPRLTTGLVISAYDYSQILLLLLNNGKMGRMAYLHPDNMSLYWKKLKEKYEVKSDLFIVVSERGFLAAIDFKHSHFVLLLLDEQERGVEKALQFFKSIR